MENKQEMISRLRHQYGEPRTALRYETPFQLLVATILSAQCTDKRVNKVTPKLFQKYQTPQDFAKADREEIEKLIHSTGFYRQKAQSIQKSSQKIANDFNGKVPDNMKDLLILPGVARKTANVVLQNAFEKTVGVVVDTHVKRVGKRLGLHSGGNPVKVEQELMKNLPEREWIFISHALIEHGRAVCHSRKPKCPKCFLKDVCPSSEKFIKGFWS